MERSGDRREALEGVFGMLLCRMSELAIGNDADRIMNCHFVVEFRALLAFRASWEFTISVDHLSQSPMHEKVAPCISIITAASGRFRRRRTLAAAPITIAYAA